MSREDDAKIYRQLHPGGEARTVITGGPRRYKPYWRCRPVKGHGPWQALPNYSKDTGDK